MLAEEMVCPQSTEGAVECESPTEGGAGEREGGRRCEGRLRYKKLKQRLQVLSEQVMDQGLLKDPKDIASPNKARLMKLALELEKALRTQAVEYPLVESLLREVQKIL